MNTKIDIISWIWMLANVVMIAGLLYLIFQAFGNSPIPAGGNLDGNSSRNHLAYDNSGWVLIRFSIASRSQAQIPV